MRRVSFWPWLATLALACAPARADQVMADIRADHWTEAAAAAANDPDPVAGKLVTFYRLLAPGQASVAEIDRFTDDSPDWPFQGTLARRRDEALAAEPDDATALAACPRAVAARALERCAVAAADLGRAAEAALDARRAWVAWPADAAEESRFLARWGSLLSAADQWQRFDRLAWSDTAGAARQATRLGPADQARATARLALRRDDPLALTLVQALPPAEQIAPGMMLEQARYLRRADRDAEAQALWLAVGTAAERAAPPEHRPAFWQERNILARHRLRDGDAAGAYALAAGHAQSAAEPAAEAEFLAGFIALRRLDDRAKAAAHFRRLADGSAAAITEARAHYWLARAEADRTAAQRDDAAAAAYPSTFYGQLAALTLGGERQAWRSASSPPTTRRGMTARCWPSPGARWRGPAPIW